MNRENMAILAGRLVADPELRYNEDEIPTAFFGLKIRKGEAGRDETIHCTASGELAKIVGEYLKRGKLIAVEGKITNLKKGKQIMIANLQMLDSKFYNATKKGGREEVL